MSENQVVDQVVAGETVATQTEGEVGRTNVSEVAFRDALLEAVRTGGTLTDVAEKLGLKPTSVYQRYNAWRKAGAKIAKIPMRPRAERKGRQLSNRMADLFAGVDSGSDNQNENSEGSGETQS